MNYTPEIMSGHSMEPLETVFKQKFHWEKSIQYLKGVGPKRVKLLERLGIRTLEDLLYYFPWRYEDRRRLSSIQELRADQSFTIQGVIQSKRVIVTRGKRFRIVQILVGDHTGSILSKWFNQPYLSKMFEVGQKILLSGKVSIHHVQRCELFFNNPVFECIEEGDESKAALSLHMGRIVPVYHETRGISSRQIRLIIHQALKEFIRDLSEHIPSSLLKTFALPELRESIEAVHFPSGDSDLSTLERAGTPAQHRVIFGEFLLLQLGLGLRRQEKKHFAAAHKLSGGGSHYKRHIESLPYKLTKAQVRVLEEIQKDLSSGQNMNRLLQGDVGCGKTSVAMAAITVAVDNGYQAAFMVPTEILAEQHYQTVKKLLGPLGISCTLITQGHDRKGRKNVEAEIASGRLSVIIGTHALIQKTIQFHKLGLIVVDEQHKFGVMQRASLGKKGRSPHVLVMTATPIPRTLALSVYGDLDISIIDEIPGGRGPIQTKIYYESQRSELYVNLRREINKGRQAYIIYPLVEESEKLDLKAAVKMADTLQKTVYPDLQVGLLHGKLKTEEKEAMMASFREGKIHIMVATTVVEVGLDIPNASVMVIEHAERFGLAQLHQLRGRIGRGPYSSTCILMTSRRIGEDAMRRLQVLSTYRDGFKIAEEDLLIRGPGEFFGTRQSGLPELRAANIIRDASWLFRARESAQEILKKDPRLEQVHHVEMRKAVVRKWKARLELSEIG